MSKKVKEECIGAIVMMAAFSFFYYAYMYM